ncbi:hypothetical protein AB0D45_29880 [Streptomyces sp. NPDC048352]|uniref:hypothetical protein n=1 Tax=Streptomyces sp. NPDC048352 TaxID=3154718 RepID=UPI003436B3B6
MAKDTDLLRRVTGFTAGFEAERRYRPPTPAERAVLTEGVSALFDGNTDRARTRLGEVGYRLDTFTDRPGGRRYAEVAEASGGAAERGWGRVYAELGTPPRWSVQVPHPVADRDTERLGVSVLRGAPGGVMVLAGAHREAGGSGDGSEGGSRGGAEGGEDDEGTGSRDPADVAHRADSVFHAVVAELTRRGLPGVQLHGFADSSVPGTGAVVSTGAGSAAADDARRLAARLEDRGVEPCRAWAAACRLSGRTNEQGRLAAAHGTRFLHLELSRSVRDDPRRRESAARAVSYVTRGWAGT